MAREPFKGTVNVDIRDSVPDWSPFELPRRLTVHPTCWFANR
jgi:hypothetical protein